MNDDAFGRAFRGFQQYKRRADRSAMEALAGFFLLSAFVFWSVAFWQLLTPPAIVSQLTIQTAVLALVFGVAAPLLWSALLPTTAAGQLLQKSQFLTIGQVVTTAAAIYLTYAEYQLLFAWLTAQTAIADSGLVVVLDLALLIGFVLIPALAWTQIPFDRMMSQIRQNHEIKRLEIMQRGDLALLKTHLIRAEVLTLRGYANLMPAEQAEVREIMTGLMLGIADAQRNIARMTGLSADYDKMLGIADDEQVARVMSDLGEQLNAPAQLIEGSIAPDPTHVDTRLQSSIPRETPDDTRRHMTTGDDAYARAARETFGRTPWTVKKLAERLEIGETKAREMRDAWLATGTIQEANLGRWFFADVTERGGQA